MKLKLWLVISPVLLWFFSRKLILSLKATFSHEAAQGTPTMLLILLRIVYTPLRLGMNQCRHPCKWTSRSSQLFLGNALCFPLHVSVKRILLGKGTSRPQRQGSWTYTSLLVMTDLGPCRWTNEAQRIVCLIMKFKFLVKSLQHCILRLRETAWNVAAYEIFPFRALALGR